MPVPDHLACLLRSLYVSRDTTVRTRQGTTDWFHFEKGLISLLMRVKEDSKQIGLKVNMKKKNLRSWHLVPSLHGNGSGKIGNRERFNFLRQQNHADGDCSHGNKRQLLLGRKLMTNLDSILKYRNISLLTKVYIVKDMVFASGHVWM